MKTNKGLFIAIEGPDGSGKSTIAKMIKNHLDKLQLKCELTREPGGTDIGENIREVILDNDNNKMSSRTEALLYAASRAQHVEEKIKPLLESGYIVICDRYVLSSLAYQGYARGLGIEEVSKINEFAINGVYPDITLFFDVSTEITLSRKFVNRDGDRIENEGSEFHKKTYKGYKKSIETYNENVSIINANTTLQNIFNQCVKEINEFL